MEIIYNKDEKGVTIIKEGGDARAFRTEAQVANGKDLSGGFTNVKIDIQQELLDFGVDQGIINEILSNLGD